MHVTPDLDGTFDCPRYWADWSPLDWCPFCATFHGHGHIDMYCGSDNCFVCGADTVGDNTHTWCDWGAHDCPKADGLCALRDPGG
ncbi:MAG: hypothetical protein FWH21_08950, partial [Kiritimatiellaeota bacterium]|nr:hypothetical protein [Kiritimatiellota bacterium]